MQTIYLEANMVPATLRGAYSGKKFSAVVTDTVTIPANAGLWSGGSREQYYAVNLNDGTRGHPAFENAAPWNNGRRQFSVKLEPGLAVVRHSIFCGKDMGLCFYVHPDNAAKLLPAPAAKLTATEQIVLNATCSYKSSYAGMDRYEMARGDCRNGVPFPSRDDWAYAKNNLIALGMLNKAGAVTPKGRNARPSKY